MTTVAQPNFKLGKAAPKRDPRSLKLGKYINLSQLPSPPDDVDHSTACKQNFPMDGNDVAGDCTCAAACHMIQVWTALSGNEQVPTTDDAFGAYSAVTGYNPKTGDNDNGAVELDVLNFWRQAAIAGQKILTHVEVDVNNPAMLQVAHWLFGGLYFGADMPQAWQSETGAGDTWTRPPGGALVGIWSQGTWGGHAFDSVRFNVSTGLWEIITWGFKQQVEAAAVPIYFDEAHAILPEFWLNNFPDEAKRGGFDFDQLKADLLLVTTQALNT